MAWESGYKDGFFGLNCLTPLSIPQEFTASMIAYILDNEIELKSIQNNQDHPFYKGRQILNSQYAEILLIVDKSGFYKIESGRYFEIIAEFLRREVNKLISYLSKIWLENEYCQEKKEAWEWVQNQMNFLVSIINHKLIEHGFEDYKIDESKISTDTRWESLVAYSDK